MIFIFKMITGSNVKASEEIYDGKKNELLYGFDMGQLSTCMTDEELKDTIKNYNLLYIQEENNNNMRKEEENA